MSTKIYDAYKVKEGLDIFDIYSFLKKIREKHIENLLNMLSDYYRSRVGSNFVDIYDAIQYMTRKGYNDPLNIYSSVVIYLDMTASGEIVYYIQFFGVNREVIDEYENKNLFFDFHYQNQTDEPEDISIEEWNHRKEVWDRLLTGSGIPSEHGLIFKILEEIDSNKIAWEICEKLKNDMA